MADGDMFEHGIVSPGGAGAHRLDVVAPGVGRRRWTREAKARIIAESIDLCGVSLRIPEGVSADHIGRVLSAVRGAS